jgi:CHAD domain-containing protein
MADGKWIEGLTPEMGVAEAATAVLATRLDVVRHYLPLASEKPYDDPEYIHQLRVGTRRVGAALRVFADCLPGKQRRSLRRRLRAIRRAAGDARDWDVFLIGLSESRSLTAAAGRPALDYLAGYAMGERSAAQAQLAQTAAQAGPKFMEESAALPGLAHAPKAKSAPATFGELATAQFGPLLAVFNSAAAANPRDPSALHRLRIQGKRLRYALEIFAACFPPQFKVVLYAAVEQLQEILGSIQDSSVGIEYLTALRERIRKSLPDEWGRLKKGFDAQLKAMRGRMPAGRRAYQKWRRNWQKLVRELKLESAVATVVAS